MKTGTKKTLLIVTAFLLSALFTLGNTQSIKFTILPCIISFIFGFILTPLIKFNSLYYHLIFEKPKWTDKMNQKSPLIFLHLIGYLFLAAGAGIVLVGLADKNILNIIGMVLLVAGLGVLTGMYLTLAIFKRNKQKSLVK